MQVGSLKGNSWDYPLAGNVRNYVIKKIMTISGKGYKRKRSVFASKRPDFQLDLRKYVVSNRHESSTSVHGSKVGADLVNFLSLTLEIYTEGIC